DAGSAIAFGFGRQFDRLRQESAFDVAFRLEENHWNGTVAPQLVIRRVFDAEPRYRELRDWLARFWREGRQAWPPDAAAIFAELDLGEGESGRPPPPESPTFPPMLRGPGGGAPAPQATAGGRRGGRPTAPQGGARFTPAAAQSRLEG